MNVKQIMNDICDDLQKEAQLSEYYVYEVKQTHQVIRRHLDKFNNVDLADVSVAKQTVCFGCIRAVHVKDIENIKCLECINGDEKQTAR